MSRSILTFVVEDSPTIRRNLIPALEDLAGAEVVGLAETEDEAVHWLRLHPQGWDLAVIDMFLKTGSGIGVLEVYQNRHAHQRVAVLTNYATDDMQQRCMKLGADAIFDKSTELDEFFLYCQDKAA